MTIKSNQHSAPFTHHVYESIDSDIKTTFSPKQVRAIKAAISANKPYQKHPFDLRGIIPLFFLRLYFVILIGRDKRQPTRDNEAKRRQSAVLGSVLLSVYILTCMLLPIGFLMLYVLKTLLGIDLIEGEHLSDLFSI
mgnify:CR=1 FL=1